MNRRELLVGGVAWALFIGLAIYGALHLLGAA
jgi:hypothetical protein